MDKGVFHKQHTETQDLEKVESNSIASEEEATYVQRPLS